MSGAIIHEWIARSGGAEQVVAELSALYPDAGVWVLWSDDPARLAERNVTESWIAGTGLRRSKVLALPFMLPTWRRLRSDRPIDWLLISSHLFAHHARFGGLSPQPAAKLVYAHTPARYIWAPEYDDRGTSFAARAGARLLKPIDRRRAAEATSVAANSEFTRERIQMAWQRDAEVIYPPVAVREMQSVSDWAERVTAREALILETLPDEFVLGASRFVSYKQIDVAIRAGEAVGLPVIVAGAGPDEERLRDVARTARVPVTFVISPSDPLLRALYSRATVFVFAAIEDFGIMPVEAMALGTPVVISPIGGAGESVVDGVTGAVLTGMSVSDLRSAVERAAACDRAIVAENARRFDSDRFRLEITEWMSEVLDA